MFASAARGLAILGAGLALLAAPLAALAADVAPSPTPILPPGIILTTQDAAIGAAPGKAITFPVSVTNNTTKLERIKLSIEAAPKDWAPVFQDRGYDVTEVELLPGKDNTVTFQITPPTNTPPGSQRLSLKGVTDDGLSTTLNLGVTITGGGAGGSSLKLTTDYPVLRGASGAKFEFKATIANNTGKDNTFGLSATAPGADWLVYFQPSFDQKQISSIQVKSGSTSDVNVEVQSPQLAKPNDFPINVKVSDDAGNTAGVDLKVTIIGNYKLDFNPQQRLNYDADAGRPQTLQITFANTGTAPVQNVSLTATGLPSGWTVNFQPDKIDSIDPGTQRSVQATLTPAAKAIAGDYSITFSASSAQASVNKDFRITVKTPTIWGWVGLGIVVIVVGGLVWMFASYSRR
jgi:uncharacterized membrane protein